MSVRPLDVALTIQRTPEINRTQTGEQMRPEVAQQLFAERLNKEVELQDRHVMQTYKTDENRVDKDGRQGGGAYAQKDKKDKNKKDEKSSGAKSGGNGGMFDITI
jgi:hypothetical protein